MRTFRRVKPLSYISVIISLLLLSITMVYFIIRMSYQQFEAESKGIRERYYTYQKQIIKNEVESVYEYIEYHRKKSEDALKSNVQQEVYTVYDIISNFYYANNDTKSQQELVEEISNMLYKISASPITKYYFAVQLEDKGLIVPEAENDDDSIPLIKLEDNSHVEEMIQLVKEQGEGFYEYNWCEKCYDDPTQSKLSFVKYFEPLDIFIGTGIYIDEMEAIIKNDLLERIATIRYDGDGYFFVDTYEGIALVFADENYVGKDVSGIKDINGVSIHNEEMKLIESAGQGYLEYVWTKPDSEGVYPKITYVKGIDRWQWIIGTGVYVDEIEETIATIESDLKKEIRSNILGIIIVIGLLALILLLFQFSIVRKIISLTQQEDEIYSIITELSVDGILIINPSGYIIDINQKGLELIGLSRKESQGTNVWDLFKDNVSPKKATKKHIFKETQLKNLKGQIIPVELNMKSTKLGRKRFYIVYLRDLTKRVEYEKKLEELALMDELTGVFNRRFIIGQIEKEINKQKRHKKPISIAMADLDFFKKVNDTYGHTYGDEILKYFTRTIEENIREMDYVGRYGGEEFIIIFPDTEKEVANMILKRIKNIVKYHTFDKKELQLTFSAGIVEINKKNNNLDIHKYLDMVDKLLYKAKENGRDRIEF